MRNVARPPSLRPFQPLASGEAVVDDAPHDRSSRGIALDVRAVRVQDGAHVVLNQLGLKGGNVPTGNGWVWGHLEFI